MIQFQSLKKNWAFTIICGLFFVTVVTGIIVYGRYNDYWGSKNSTKDEVSLEVNLPIIEWGKYESLSKKLTNAKVRQ
jgi:hypothetical protein